MIIRYTVFIVHSIVYMLKKTCKSLYFVLFTFYTPSVELRLYHCANNFAITGISTITRVINNQCIKC